ncbi:NAD(P)/FAD-dependent oxidoreductase [Aliihoeflea sp. 2WW]|uniref:FAD-dependent oxidoreductase n=1 Tax=Aliihoeflea sp. 2WW TaxID=1381123 RepID=UPI0004674B5A|nr:NAD(P)/FAD-dependent oxidoreductase [Aliihoeflea sp. 2WW]
MPSVVIIGAGVAGSALAFALASRGIETTMLEKSRFHVDRVRGEWIAPWGVLEARQLRLYDRLLRAGAHHVTCHLSFPETGLGEPLHSDLSTVVEGVRGPLTMQHVQICNALNAAAVEAGARLLRGVDRLQFIGSKPSRITFTRDGVRHEMTCDLLVGADGRGSSVCRQLGIRRLSDPPRYLITGLLVEEVQGWPDTAQTIGTEGDVVYFVFPQGGGRSRLYLVCAKAQKGRFAGAEGARKFLEAFRFGTVEGSEALAAARPDGPCRGYPNEDVWSTDPAAEGAVLIGDAAGHNDPIAGQGLSIAFRDARLVSEILSSSSRWGRAEFQPYVRERRERMRRMRFMGRLIAEWRAGFDEEGTRRRHAALLNHQRDPEAVLPAVASLLGVHTLPAELFTAEARDRFFGSRMQPWTDELAPLQAC